MQFGVSQKWKSLTIEILFTLFQQELNAEPILAWQTPMLQVSSKAALPCNSITQILFHSSFGAGLGQFDSNAEQIGGHCFIKS